jgi:hypothetical protein
MTSIKFFWQVKRSMDVMAKLEIHASSWELTVVIFLMIASIGCLLVVSLRSKAGDFIALGFLACQIIALAYWYYQLMLRVLYPHVTVSAVFFSEDALNVVMEHPVNFAHAGLALLLAYLLLRRSLWESPERRFS